MSVTALSPADQARTAFVADVVSGRIQLPTISRVVQQLIVGLRKQDISFHEIGRLVEQDPVLSARVLRLANSPFYCGRRNLASIQDAASVIGTNALQTLVLACGVSAAFVSVSGVNLGQFWQDAVITASTARLLAQRIGIDPDSAYSAGLLSGTGHLILCQAFPTKAQAAFTRYTNLRGARLAEQEELAFGLSHPAVGAIWADKLSFPTDTVEAIAHHLTLPSSSMSALSRLTALSRQLAEAVVEQTPLDTVIPHLPAVHLEALTLTDHIQSPGFASQFESLRNINALN